MKMIMENCAIDPKAHNLQTPEKEKKNNVLIMSKTPTLHCPKKGDPEL